MTFAIETIGLGKRFTASHGYRDLLPGRKRRQIEVLRDIDLQIPQGEIFGILGPNGAGKTTLLKILATLILPTTGSARIMGVDASQEPDVVKESLTYAVSEERSLYWRLTGKQNLQYFAAMSNVHRREAEGRIEKLLSLLDLSDAADRRVMYYSTGMRQKLALARALITDPEILLLDEPARSVDPLMAGALWRFIEDELVARRGMTVLLATHNLDEARRVCDRVAVLHQGKIQACGSVDQLIADLGGECRYSLTLDASANGVHHVLQDIPGVQSVQSGPSEDGSAVAYDILVAEPEAQVPLILESVIRARGKVLSLTRREHSLRDVLASLTKERAYHDL